MLRRRCAWVAAFAVAGCLSLATDAWAVVYWANAGNGTIGRANLDGTGVNEAFISGSTTPYGVAIDSRYIYWTNWGGGGTGTTIGRANLDGTGVNQSFISGANAPLGVAVDSQHIYWSNYGNGTIGRANLDGTGVNQSFISGADTPYGVAVDGQHVYWTNSLVNGVAGTTIGRANLDGSGVNQSFISGANLPVGVAVDGLHVYWANYGGSGTLTSIGRANIDGSGVNNLFITATSIPNGVAVSGGSPPSIIALPAIRGSSTQAQTLTAMPGSWTNGPTGFRYQWQRCDPSGANCAAIPGANRKTYALRLADVGSRMGIGLIASNAYGSGAAFSSLTTVVSPSPRIASTMYWSFPFSGGRVTVAQLLVVQVPLGARVEVSCRGKGCPYAHHGTTVTAPRTRCKGAHCKRPPRTRGVDLAPQFRRHRLAFGARITIRIVKVGWVGKIYIFPIHSSVQPKIACLAPGGSQPGRDC